MEKSKSLHLAVSKEILVFLSLMHKSVSTYSIVIPAYKSSMSLEILAQQLSELAQKHEYKFEMIFVNDSPFFRETCTALKKIEQLYQAKILTLRKNQGQHLALLTGISVATGDFIITMDDDLQHPVKEIPLLIEAIKKEQVDAVFAIPAYKDRNHTFFRTFSSYLLSKIDTFFLKKPKGLVKSAFRIMTKDIANVIVANFNAMPSVSSLIINTTHNIINVKVDHHERAYGESNYNLRKLLNLTLNNILHYSSLPLKLIGIIGFLGFIFSVLFVAMVIVRKLFFKIDYPGYASTVSLICFFGGLNLLAGGIIGEYLIRVIKEQQKPNLKFLIQEH